MKALVERLASGASSYETPDAEISENRIAHVLECGESAQGEISINSKNDLSIKGVVYSTDSHIVFSNNQFHGVNNKVRYIVNSDNLYEGQICEGTISVITTGGDYAIPFGITIKKTKIDSTIGEIESLDDFVKLVKESYDEALILFLSKEFREFFLKDDKYGYTLYKQVLKNANRSVALEEFLVGMKLKKRVVISLKERLHEYTDITENYGGVINIAKNTWGNADIDVSIEGDFLYNCKECVTGDEFNGKIAEYQYFINVGRLHGGSNHGRITFRTTNETLEFDIVIVNEKNADDNYINDKKNDILFVKNYIDFRTGAIDGTAWKKGMEKIADERLKNNAKDMEGLLAKAQVAILNGNETDAMEGLNMIASIISQQTEKNIDQYCYYLYLRSLYKGNAEFSNEIKNEIKEYFENGHDSWQILWILFYMDERYDDNPTLKYTLIKRLFNNGCTSPIMYYEAAKVLLEQPEHLRILNQFEIQVLNFIGRYNIASENLAKQAAELIDKEREFNKLYFNILVRLYEATKLDEVLSCICSMIISGNKTDKEYFKWLELGVERELKITNLYEYYIYTIDTSNYDRLKESAYKYFSYGTDTLVANKDYYFANIVNNFGIQDEIYIKSFEDMSRYVTSEIVNENNNKHLRHIYQAILSDDFIVGDLEEHMPTIMHTYMFELENKNIRSMTIAHKEISNMQTVPVTDGVAYAQLYTKDAVIMFMDYKGRFLTDIPCKVTKLLADDKITKVGNNNLKKLMLIENILENPKENAGKALELKEALEIPNITEQYSSLLKEFCVDYYYNRYDNGELDIFLLQFEMSKLSIRARNKVMEILIDRNLFEMVYPYIAKYGYQAIRKDLLEKICVELVNNEEYNGNPIVVEMCGCVFRNGCREDAVLKFLGKYYEAGSLELYQLFLAVQSKGIEDNTIAKRILVQYIFENNTEDKLYVIYREYLKKETASNIRKAFYTYVCYNYFIKKVQCPDYMWEILEQEYEEGLNTTMISKIAFVEVMSKKESLTERQLKITENLVFDLAKNNINFEFYKKFNKWFKIPFDLVDKTIIDFRTNPKHKVDISYAIKTPEGYTKRITEEMGSIYPGVFTKEVIMFYGEEISYSITEYSDENPEGKVVDNYSVKITEKNIYNDETRFGMVNGMMICKDLGRDEAAREMMQSYELYKVIGKESFKLL